MTHPGSQSRCWSCATALDSRAHTCPSCNARVSPQVDYGYGYGNSPPQQAPPATGAPPYAQGRGYDPSAHDPSALAHPPAAPGHGANPYPANPYPQQDQQGYGYGQHDPRGYPARPIVVYAPKSAGVAVLLSFLWLGAGHLYAGQTAVGVVLLIVDFFLWLISFTVIGLIVTIPIWLILLPIAMITSANAVSSYNTRIARLSY